MILGSRILRARGGSSKPVAVYRDILSPEDWGKIKATGATLRDFQKHVVPLIDKEWGLTGK